MTVSNSLSTMLLGVVFSALIVNSFAYFPEDCGELGKEFFQSREKRMIMGGKHISGSTVPWLIRIDGEDKFVCTGFLITRKLFISAAHCFSQRDEKTQICSIDRQKFSICRKVNTNNETCSKIAVKKVHFLNDYVYTNCDDKAKDFVIGELQNPIDDSKFSPVCLPSEQNGITELHDYTAEPVYNFGFSRNQENKGSRKNIFLKFVQAKFPTFCKQDTKYLCTPQKTEQGICQGDSGGPMVIVRDKRAVVIAVNVRAHGKCDYDVVIPDPPSPDYQMALILRKFAAQLNMHLGRRQYQF